MSLINAVKNKVQQAKKSVAATVSRVKQGVSSVISTAASKVKAVTSSVTSKAASVVSKPVAVVKSTVSKAATVVSSAASKVTSTAQAFKSALSNPIKKSSKSSKSSGGLGILPTALVNPTVALATGGVAYRDAIVRAQNPTGNASVLTGTAPFKPAYQNINTLPTSPNLSNLGVVQPPTVNFYTDKRTTTSTPPLFQPFPESGGGGIGDIGGGDGSGLGGASNGSLAILALAIAGLTGVWIFA